MRQIQVAANKLSPVTKYYRTHDVFHGYWKNASHQREFFQWFFQQHKFTSLEDWYNVTLKDIYAAGGGTLLNHLYKGSLQKALKVAYPQHDWKIWKFKQIPRHYWAHENHVREYLQWYVMGYFWPITGRLSEQLAITKLEDWYSVNQQLIPRSLVLRYGTVGNLFKKFFPGFSWKEVPRRKGSKAQGTIFTTLAYSHTELLVRCIRNLFPEAEIKIDYRHPKMLFEDSQYRMELDIFVPSKDIAFEYHGEQHFKWHYLNGDPTAVQKRDQAKRDTCKAAGTPGRAFVLINTGITLIEIPFWWDRSMGSLAATIHQHRRDLVEYLPHAKPISSSIPSSIAAKFRTAVSNLLHELAKPLKWNMNEHSDLDISNFYVTKLMGGLRVHWDGKSQLVAFNGSILSAPKEFLEALPKMAVDAELHCGPNTYFQVAKMLQSGNEDWTKLSMCVLDMPYQSDTFESRLEHLQAAIHEFNAGGESHRVPVDLADFKVFETTAQLQDYFASNAENGVMLRRAHTHYISPSSLYIHKEISQEALVVVGHKGTSIECKKTDGSETTIEGNPADHPIGSVIITKSQNDKLISIDKPNGLLWEDILKEVYLPFRISQGKPLGGLPRCRACHRVFVNREEPRVTVKGVFTPADAAPYPATFNVCLNAPCITKSLDVAKKKANFGYYFPPFTGKIGLPSYLKDMVHVEQLGLPDTEFVLL